jgi:hypothetical protein
MIRLNRFILTFLCLIFSSEIFCQQITTEEKSAAFANYLFKTNQYQFASEEYEKLLFFFPQNDEYRLKLVQSCRFSKDFDKGIAICQNFINTTSITNRPILIEYSKLNILDNNYPNLTSLVLSMPQTDTLRLNIDLASRLIFLPEKSLNTNGIDMDKVDKNLLNFYNESFNLNRKSPVLAGFMSAIIPGSGKIYTNRWKDGIIAFVFIGATSYQTYRGFHQKGIKSAYGWIMGSVGFSFYLGNIYGSAKSAKNYNENQRSKYVEKVSDYYMGHF